MNHKVKLFNIIAVIMLAAAPFQHISGQTADVGLRTVVIDPGHGGKDPGAPGPDSKHSEKHIVLNISKLLGEKIKEAYPSVKVAYTRTGDTFPKLTDRVQIAHDNNADLFISIHCNSSTNRSATGSSAHILSRKDSRNPNRDLFDENVELTKLENSVIAFEEDQSSYQENSAEDQILNTLLFHANFDHSVMFAQLVVEKLATKPFHKWGKGIHQNDFLLLKKMTCPAVLVETAFLSNASERQLLVSSKWQEEIADRLFKAFKEYKTIYDASVGAGEMMPDVQEQASSSKVNTEPDAEEYYAVQIMGLARLLKNGDPALKGLEVQAVKAADSNIYKYVCGKHSSKETAAERLAVVKKKFPDAFIVKVTGDKVTRVE